MSESVGVLVTSRLRRGRWSRVPPHRQVANHTSLSCSILQSSAVPRYEETMNVGTNHV